MPRPSSFKSVARILFAAVLCWWILRAVPFGEAASRLASASIPLVLLALGTSVVATYVQAVRWKILLAGSGPSTWKLFLWNLVGGAASFVLPSSASGDVVKALLMGREEGVLGRSVMSTVLGRYIGMIATLAVCLLGFLLWPQVRSAVSLRSLLAAAASLVGAAIGGVVVLRLLHSRRSLLPVERKWARRLNSALEIFHEATTHPGIVARSFALSIVLQFTNLFAGWLLFRAVGDDVGFAPVLALMPLVQLGTIVPLTVGGIGIREGLTLGLFHGLAGMPRENCLAANLAGYVVTAGLALFGLAAWMTLRADRKRANTAPQDPSA